MKRFRPRRSPVATITTPTPAPTATPLPATDQGVIALNKTEDALLQYVGQQGVTLVSHAHDMCYFGFVRTMYTFFGQAEAMRSVRKVTTNIGQTPSPHRGPALDLRAQILDRMNSTGVWTPNDFLDMGSRAAVDKVLQRLATSNTIRRIDRGLYDVPRVNRLTGKPTNPDYRAVIDAVARRDKARLLVDGIMCSCAAPWPAPT